MEPPKPPQQQQQPLPIITLPYNIVLLPGAILRLPIDDRRDIQALLAKITYETFEKEQGNGVGTNTAVNGKPTDGTAGDAGNVGDGSGDKSQVVIGGGGGEPRQPPVFVIGFIPLDPFKNTPMDPTNTSSTQLPPSRSNESLHYRSLDPSTASLDDLCEIGTVGKVVGVEQGRVAITSDSTDSVTAGPTRAAILIEGQARFRIRNITQKTPFLLAEIDTLQDIIPDPADVELNSLFSTFQNLATTLLHLLRQPLANGQVRTTIFPAALARRLQDFINRTPVVEAGKLVDFFVAAMDPSLEERLGLLKTTEVVERLRRGNAILGSRVETIKLALGYRDEQATAGKELILRGPLRRSRSPGPLPLGPGGSRLDEESDQDLQDLLQKLNSISPFLPESSQKIIDREVKRLRRMTPMQPDYPVQRTYLETLAEIPWGTYTDDQLGIESLARARRILDEDHYGLAKVKRRVLEYLAVLRLKAVVGEEQAAAAAAAAVEVTELEAEAGVENVLEGNTDVVASPTTTSTPAPPAKPTITRAPILLLAGPPGTGKTSLAKSIATALGRKFHRVSLGGVHSEAEIRGHRRTYIAAMPGLIVSGLRKVGVSNPVVLLDEIDKVGGRSHNGDPAAALLEVLDPEQNHLFTDHYVGLPIDLSRVIFIATANYLSEIPPALLDRMEIIHLHAYTNLEKFHISTRFLVPKQVALNGLVIPSQIYIPDKVVHRLITGYTREPGVRNLEREIGSVVRAKAVQFVDAKDNGTLARYSPEVRLEELEGILGVARYHAEDITERENRPGVVNGLVAFSTGRGVMTGSGAVIFIEAAAMPGNGGVQLTGNLGSVIKESVEVALTWVKAHAYELGLTHNRDDDLTKNKSIHVHCPAGSDPKDGPSAGVAFVVALISLFSDRPVPATIAMTGEVSLQGRVTAVGAIKEKLIGALSAGITTALVPSRNRFDVQELPEEVKRGINVICVSDIWDVLREVWPDWRIITAAGHQEALAAKIAPITSRL